eukprot:174983_1
MVYPAVESVKAYVGSRGGGYGLDAELSKKAVASYDYDAENEARLWIEEVTGVKTDGDLGSCLKDGALLCKVINAVKPGTIKRINTSKMPFKQMENISIFLRACRTLGVPEYSLFETVDLFEEKDLSIVIRCIHSLGGAVQKSCPDYSGPRLGVAQRAPAIRQWTDEQRKRQAKKAAATPTILSKGSSATMEKSKVVLTGITMGADCGGASKAPNVVAQANLGSSRTMEKTKVVKTGITMGADCGGPSKVPNTVSKANLGSYGIQERLNIPNNQNIMAADCAAAGHKPACFGSTVADARSDDALTSDLAVKELENIPDHGDSIAI